MTVIPELEKHLVEAAAQLQSRQMRRRHVSALIRRAAPIGVAMGGMVIAFVLAVGSLDDEREAIPSSSGPASGAALADLKARFDIFEREQRNVDRELPARVARALSLDVTSSRLVGADDGVSVRVAVSTGGEDPELCHVVRTTEGSGSSGCRSVEEISRGSSPALQSTTGLSGNRQAFFALVDDDVRNVRLSLRDGTVLNLQPKSNGVLAVLDSGVAAVAVTDSQGVGEVGRPHDDPLDASD